MAWLGKVTLGNFGDIAGAVTKLSESVKNIERNFDSALGFDETQSSAGDRINLLEPVFSFVTQREVPKDLNTKESSTSEISEPTKTNDNISGSEERIENDVTSSENDNYSPSSVEKEVPEHDACKETTEQKQILNNESVQTESRLEECTEEVEKHEKGSAKDGTSTPLNEVIADADLLLQERSINSVSGMKAEVINDNPLNSADYKGSDIESFSNDAISTVDISVTPNVQDDSKDPGPMETEEDAEKTEITTPVFQAAESSGSEDEKGQIEHLKAQLKMMEDALQGAAHQSKIKADELSRLSLENDNLRSVLEEMKKTSAEAEIDAMKEEFQQRLNAAERKVYALTKERDMLRREQGRKESAVLLKEKDEIIKQVMAEGEELSKKQAAQEATMRKLRAQIRELEEEKQRLKSKLQVEEATVESIRKDKAVTEKALQEAVERTQVELALQKEFYTKALNEAKEAEARAEARADNEIKLELERRLREAGDRETALVQNLDELRQALSRAAQQAAFREDMLQKDIEDLERRCQAAELRYEELVASVPESTRPLLRQIEAIRETMAARTDAWSGVERALNARLQEAEAKAAAAQERERAINERLTQTLSRMAVLEAQVSCLKAEQAQLTRSLEKERQRASENRQEYLAAVEAAATHEGHAKQLEEDIKELRSKFKRELAEERTMRELLQQDLEQEKRRSVKKEGSLGNLNWPISEKANGPQSQESLESSPSRNLRRYSSVSAGSPEESYYLQVSLDSASDQISLDRRNSTSGLSSYGVKGSVPIEQLEALLSQKEGEIALYTSRLASLESTRNALAEELVNATTQCEKLRTEVASLPGLRSELESLRQRHTSALELMGERDEQVEELKADLADVKQMYREQIDMLVNQIEQLSVSMTSSPRNL